MSNEDRDSYVPGPETVIRDLENGMRYGYFHRIESARRRVREARDRADAATICAQQATEEMREKMAEYRRGRWYDIAAIVTSAATGFTVGYHTQKVADLRIGGVPVTAVAGLPAILGSATLDESVVTRATLAVGGTMFMIGATTYTIVKPGGAP